MKLTKKEMVLFGIASALLAFMLISSWMGYKTAGYINEFNPVAKRIFEILYSVTGNLDVSVLVFVPLTILGIFFAVWIVERDLRKSGYTKGKEVTFITLIFLLIPNALYNAGILRIDLSLLTVICFGAAGIYLTIEWIRWKKSR